jgi:hypothetical protein
LEEHVEALAYDKDLAPKYAWAHQEVEDIMNV